MEGNKAEKELHFREHTEGHFFSLTALCRELLITWFASWLLASIFLLFFLGFFSTYRIRMQKVFSHLGRTTRDEKQTERDEVTTHTPERNPRVHNVIYFLRIITTEREIKGILYTPWSFYIFNLDKYYEFLPRCESFFLEFLSFHDIFCSSKGNLISSCERISILYILILYYFTYVLYRWINFYLCIYFLVGYKFYFTAIYLFLEKNNPEDVLLQTLASDLGP